MSSLLTRIQYIQHTIHETEIIPHSVRLLAVSKQQPPEAIREAYAAGIRDFGENYLQEALPKIEALHDLSIIWHFIGPIQRNKAKRIAETMDWVHSLDRLSVAKKLNESRKKTQSPLQVCIQINLDLESQKAGILPEDALSFARMLLPMKSLTLRGLMAIPLAHHDTAAQYQTFQRLTALCHQLEKALSIPLDTLSMGMSEDFKTAIRAGSTCVRIGTALFGERGHI